MQKHNLTFEGSLKLNPLFICDLPAPATVQDGKIAIRENVLTFIDQPLADGTSVTVYMGHPDFYCIESRQEQEFDQALRRIIFAPVDLPKCERCEACMKWVKCCACNDGLVEGGTGENVPCPFCDGDAGHWICPRRAEHTIPMFSEIVF